MDAALPPEDIGSVEDALARLRSEPARFDNLRTRRAGVNRFAFVELPVPPDWTVAQADELASAAERHCHGLGHRSQLRRRPSLLS